MTTEREPGDVRFERDGASVPYLGLWRLEVLSTRCAWQLWPSDATRLAYVQALAEREKCEATLLALEGFQRSDPEPFGEYQPD